MRCANATPLFVVGVPLLFVYRLHNSCAGSAWLSPSCITESNLYSSCEGAAGDELLARFRPLRCIGVIVGCEPRQNNCSSGEIFAFAERREESSTFPTRSASGNRVAGVEGGKSLD